MDDNKYTPDAAEVKRSFVLNLIQLLDADFKYVEAAEAFDRWYKSVYGLAYGNGYETGYDNGRKSVYGNEGDGGVEA